MIVQMRLMELLDLYINKQNSLIADYNKSLKFSKKQQEVKKMLDKDLEKITDVNLSILKSIIDTFKLSDTSKNLLYKEIVRIIKCLKVNKSSRIKFQLNDDEVKTLEGFKNSIDFELFLQTDIDDIKKTIRKAKKLYKMIDVEIDASFITDFETLEKVFDDLNIESFDRVILYEEMLKYNRKIYDIKTGLGNVKELEELGQIDFEKFKQLFRKFGYDFDLFSVEIQENIINRATISNIKDVLRALVRNGYKLEMPRDSYLLMSLVIESNEAVIDYISNLAFSKGLFPDEVLKIGGILIKQTRSKVRGSKSYDRFFVEDIDHAGLRIVGSSADFESNVKELARWGISVRCVYDSCKYVLLCSNKVLSHNLVLFRDYGFSLKRRVNKLTSPIWSALMEYNTFDVIDRFIEVHPLGLSYLRNNLSVLRQVNDIEDLVFYKLYYSNKNCGGQEAFLDIINNNTSLLCFKGKVSGLTSVYTSSYANLNRVNKYEITNTFVPKYSRDYYTLIKNKIDREIADSVFDSPYIKHINKYSDRKEPLIYNFDGIIISKLKVLRVFDALLEASVLPCNEAILYAVLYNTIISKEDFDKIEKMVKLNG